MSLWGETHTFDSEQILMMQKKAATAINKANCNQQVQSYFRNLRILKLGDQYNMNIGKFWYQFKLGLLPEPLMELINNQNSISVQHQKKDNPVAPIYRT